MTEGVCDYRNDREEREMTKILVHKRDRVFYAEGLSWAEAMSLQAAVGGTFRRRENGIYQWRTRRNETAHAAEMLGYPNPAKS